MIDRRHDNKGSAGHLNVPLHTFVVDDCVHYLEVGVTSSNMGSDTAPFSKIVKLRKIQQIWKDRTKSDSSEKHLIWILALLLVQPILHQGHILVVVTLLLILNQWRSFVFVPFNFWPHCITYSSLSRQDWFSTELCFPLVLLSFYLWPERCGC